jgi:hypothetical protein
MSIKIIKSRVKIAYFQKKNTKENHSRYSQASVESDHLLPPTKCPSNRTR